MFALELYKEVVKMKITRIARKLGLEDDHYSLDEGADDLLENDELTPTEASWLEGAERFDE